MTTREATLAAWLEQEKQVRAKLAAPGIAGMEALKAGTGMEFLQRIWDGELPSLYMGHTLDFVPVEGEPGRIVFQGTPGVQHYNPLGSVHGGYFCTLLDSALGCAVHSMLPKGVGYTTLELKVNLIRAMTAKTGPVRAEGKIIQIGKQVGVAEANIVDVDGKIYAHATTTCLIFPLP
ncbi:PaaI family thioesterase [Herbaspirillum sp. RTI4]|uniref:PaaI family thioesterase n=1 Tax=Herbaspirillum sp. RTI4 TaxID=3048640 RepID=UPI002AB56D5A|nr:PaaI family thioesterase [Herbaspirillum sp. RTI4]MDY7578398.1 PaaI family thioesterase [Herbaspirillum sp. RTI4]MEA9983061.1 PaaI family thioesterase [Herbaspirillum sp. RTI4]